MPRLRSASHSLQSSPPRRAAAINTPDPATVVTVRVRGFVDQPIEGAVVYGNDAADQHVGTTTTDDDGVAWLSIPAGGSITVRNAAAESWHAVLAVQPGDDLGIRFTDTGDDLFSTHRDVTVVGAPGSGTSLSIDVRCGGGNNNYVASMRAHAARPWSPPRRRPRRPRLPDRSRRRSHPPP
jgi:hypothetical protein